MTGRDDAASDGPDAGRIADDLDAFEPPGALRERDGVVYEERERTVPVEQFEALRERYAKLDGIVQFGIRDDDGRVLLAGDDAYAPLGGDVTPGDDWTTAAADAMTNVTGQAVRVDAAVAFERTTFHPEGDREGSVHADCAFFAASLVDPDPAFLEDPTFRDGLDHPLYGADTDATLAWFDGVTDAVNENHARHVEWLLD
jgi:hypothetical protein